MFIGLLIVAFIAFVVAIFLFKDGERDGGVIASVVCALAIIGAILCGITVVDAGHRGVVVLFGNVDDKPLTEGLHLVNPLASVEEMSVRTERSENNYIAETSDTQSVTVTVQMNWRPDPEKMPTLYRTFGTTYAEKIISPALNEAIRAEVSRHKVSELIVQRPTIRASVQSAVAEWIKRHDLILVEMAVANIDFSEKYDEAIESKQVEEQKAAAKIYELRGVVTEAEKREAQAKGDAAAVRAAAQGKADALRIEGEAQAQYNRLVAESLTGLIVDRMKVERWDGKLPVYMLSSATPLIALPEGK